MNNIALFLQQNRITVNDLPAPLFWSSFFSQFVGVVYTAMAFDGLAYLQLGVFSILNSHMKILGSRLAHLGYSLQECGFTENETKPGIKEIHPSDHENISQAALNLKNLYQLIRLHQTILKLVTMSLSQFLFHCFLFFQFFFG